MTTRQFPHKTGIGRFLSYGILFVIIAMTMTGCAEFTLYDLLNPIGSFGTEGPLSISPIAATIVAGAGMTFTVSGGDPPYTFTLVSGHGSIVSSVGVYTAPDVASVDIVRVVDDSASISDAQIVVVE